MSIVNVNFDVDTDSDFAVAMRQLRQAISSKMNDAEASEVGLTFFRPWQPFQDFLQGEVVRVDAVLYRVVQSHTSSPEWPPADTPALFVKLGTDEEVGSGFPPWRQPTGAHDAYMQGDGITWTDGSRWRSLFDNNVHSPAAWPAGWERIK
jgi:hypothetical protein